MAEREEILRVIEGRTLLSTFRETAERLGDEPALRWKEAGQWQTLTWREYRDLVLDVARGMRAFGFRPGEFAVIMSRNRSEALIAELATLHARGVPVHLYNTLPPEEIQYLVNHCEATFAFLEDAGFLAKFGGIRDRLEHLRRVVMFDSVGVEGSPQAWSTIVTEGRRERQRDAGWAESAVGEIGADNLATLIYTSGTTGPPKGVMLTHESVLYTITAWHRLVPPCSIGRVVSYLPLAHGAARILDVWMPLMTGYSVHFCPDPLQLVGIMIEVRPNTFTTVPRIWEKLSAGLLAGVAEISDAASRATIERTIESGRKVVKLQQQNKTIPSDLAAEYERGEPIRRSLLTKVGLDTCTHAASGAAPIDPEIIEFFQALGIPITEIWGMTELSGVATGSTAEGARNGKVGYPLPGVEIMLALDGEVLARGPLVTKGYYRDPAQTAEAIDADGWMHTGDIGSLDSEGYLAIVDRKKELIITSAGKNLSPANIEHFLTKHSLIGQAIACGDRRNYITALLVLDPVMAPAWARQHGMKVGSLEELSRDPAVLDEVERAVAAANEHLARVAQVKKWTLLFAPWTPETGELTPSLKLKRRVVIDCHHGEIDRMYASSARRS